MGLFGFGKKTVKSYFYGKIPAYTSKEELPDDVDTLKKMGLYYRLEYLDRNTNYTPAFDCLSKGYQLDKEHKDLDIPRYLGVMYYNGNGVLQDIKKGREILRQYLEPTLLKETDHSIIATCLFMWITYEIDDFDALLDICYQRVLNDQKNNSLPIGILTFDHLATLKQFSYSISYINKTIKKMDTAIFSNPAYKYYLGRKNNFGDNKEKCLEILKNSANNMDIFSNQYLIDNIDIKDKKEYQDNINKLIKEAKEKQKNFNFYDYEIMKTKASSQKELNKEYKEIIRKKALGYIVYKNASNEVDDFIDHILKEDEIKEMTLTQREEFYKKMKDLNQSSRYTNNPICLYSIGSMFTSLNGEENFNKDDCIHYLELCGERYYSSWGYDLLAKYELSLNHINEAKEYLKKASLLGDRDSQYQLANIYIEEDKIAQAIPWLVYSSREGNQDAYLTLKELENNNQLKHILTNIDYENQDIDYTRYHDYFLIIKECMESYFNTTVDSPDKSLKFGIYKKQMSSFFDESDIDMYEIIEFINTVDDIIDFLMITDIKK